MKDAFMLEWAVGVRFIRVVLPYYWEQKNHPNAFIHILRLDSKKYFKMKK